MEFIIEMLNITKKFSGIVANDNITLKLKKGEIHALLGENGAGKSTLMSVLFGLYQPESGVVKINGREVKISSPSDANNYKIGMVHQHFKLVKNFTVLENIILGVETVKGPFIEMEEARKRVIEISEKYKLKVNPDALISEISVGMQQRVEILKMLYRENEILIFDEPTAVLTPQEIDELMSIMRGLTKEGKSIIFITHKLNEIKAVANRCTVLRRGKYIGTLEVESTSKEEMSEMMVGRKISFEVNKKEMDLGEVALKVSNLVVKSKYSNKALVDGASFKLRKGEILCIAGIDGNGQSELIQAITGLIRCEKGKIELNGIDITQKSIRFRNTNGISYIPEDRHKHGLILDYDMEENLIMKSYFTSDFQHKGFLKFGETKKYSEELIKKYDIRSAKGVATKVRSMSGGNQQKIILAREIELNQDVLIAMQPTRGLDVGAIEYIHKKIVEQRNEGKAVLLVSLELDEVMDLSDRIIVMYEGEIVANLEPKNTTIQEMGLFMAGSKRSDAL